MTDEQNLTFDQIVQQQQATVVRLARRLLGWSRAKNDVDDVVQDVFLAVLKGLPNFRSQSSLTTWITRITINNCRVHRRKRFLRRALYDRWDDVKRATLAMLLTLLLPAASASAQAGKPPTTGPSLPVVTMELSVDRQKAGDVSDVLGAVVIAAMSPDTAAQNVTPRRTHYAALRGAALGGIDQSGWVVQLGDSAEGFLTGERVVPGGLVIQLRLVRPHAKGKELLDAGSQRVVAALVEQPPIPADDLARRTQAVEQRIATWVDQTSMLQAMAQNTATLGQEILKDRIKAAELERHRLEMELAAQGARRQALVDHIRSIEREADLAINSDAVLEQLRAVVPLRQEEVKRIQAMVERGVANSAEVARAEENVMQAKIRINERVETVRQNTKSTLLDRLNDELATPMIDQVEMEARLSLIHRPQPSIDLKAIDEQKLDLLTEQYRALFRNPGALPPLYYELEEKLWSLKRDRLALLVSDVKVTEVNGAKVQPDTPTP